MNPFAKFLIATGAVLIAVGLLWQIGGKFLPLGRLPGDIVVERENFRFYFPIVTSILLSVIFSAIIYLIRHFKK